MQTTNFTSLRNYLIQPINGTSLAIFRVLFGGIMAYFAWIQCSSDVIDSKFVNPDFHFTYPLFDFLRLPIFSKELMHLNFTYMGFAALGICLGFLYRASLIVFIMTFGYMFLLEKAIYNNHYYLILLFAFLFIFMKGDHWYALDNVLWPKKERARRAIPFWNVFLLRAQICIVYFFGGIAKCYPGWVSGNALKKPLIENIHDPVIGAYVQEPWLLKFIACGGLVFDFAIGFLLCFRKTRVLGCAVAFFFHASNKWLWDIGVFPYFMIGTLILFVNPASFARFIQKVKALFKIQEHPIQYLKESPDQITKKQKKGNGVVVLMAVYLLIQVTVPLRHFFYPGDVIWNGWGDRFAWRMFARSTHGFFRARVFDPDTGQTIVVYPYDDITREQGGMMSRHPDMIEQYARFLKDKYQNQGIRDPQIYVYIQFVLNGFPAAPLVNGWIDPYEQRPFWKSPSWILSQRR